MNNILIPAIKLNNEYYNHVKCAKINNNDSKFIKGEISAANCLIKNVNHRSKTIIQITKAIIEEQIDFFKHGVMYLKPLTLSRIAEITGFNESTISRGTNNKYLSSPIGIFELKYFFSSNIKSATNASCANSSIKVKELIKQLIESEKKDGIFSDDEIAKYLRKFNIDIARRTVTKYREALHYPTSSKRKRQARIAS